MYGEVEAVVRLSPSMVRIVLGGEGLERFEPTPFTDQYVNALFIPEGAPYSVPFDPEAVRSSGYRPVGRRYTIRRWDPVDRRVTVDFVVHGDAGFAGRWANRAKVGDRLQMVGPTGGYAPSATADWHLMVGDESALPAICASLEQVRSGLPTVVVVVVDGPDDEISLDCPGDAKVQWVHRQADPGNHGLLLGAVEATEFPAGAVDVFVHGEAGEVRAIRRHLLAERGISKEGASISPYWRRNFTDEAWREVKAAWVAEMRDEA